MTKCTYLGMEMCCSPVLLLSFLCNRFRCAGVEHTLVLGIEIQFHKLKSILSRTSTLASNHPLRLRNHSIQVKALTVWLKTTIVKSISQNELVPTIMAIINMHVNLLLKIKWWHLKSPFVNTSFCNIKIPVNETTFFFYLSVIFQCKKSKSTVSENLTNSVSMVIVIVRRRRVLTILHVIHLDQKEKHEK